MPAPLAIDPEYLLRDNQFWYSDCAFAAMVEGRAWIEMEIEGLGERRLLHSATGRDGRLTKSFRLPSAADRQWWEEHRRLRVRLELLAAASEFVPGPTPRPEPSPHAAPARPRSQPVAPAQPVPLQQPTTFRTAPTLFDAYLFVDWSGNSLPKLGKDSIWLADAWFGLDGAQTAATTAVENLPTRRQAGARILERLLLHQQAGRRVLLGFDFPFGYAKGSLDRTFAGAAGWRRLWTELAARIRDDARNRNNRFEVAAELNAAIGERWYWGCPQGARSRDLAPTKEDYGTPPELRQIEIALRATGLRPFTVWQLFGNGSVGSQALLGLPTCERLRGQADLNVRVWPFETGLAAPHRDLGGAVVLAEIWPGAIDVDLGLHEIRDAAQVLSLARWAAHHDAASTLGDYFTVPRLEAGEVRRTVEEYEGWILGFLP